MDRIAWVLATHPKSTLLVVFLVLVPILSFYAFHPFEIECDVRRGFANKNGRAVKEFQRFAEFYNMDSEDLEIWGILAKNRTEGESLTMSNQLLDEVNRLHTFISDYNTTFAGEDISFSELDPVELNYVFGYYRQLHRLQDWVAGINLTYPSANAFGTHFFIGSQFFGVNQNSESAEIETVKYMTLWYMNNAKGFKNKQKLQQIQMELFQISGDDNFSQLYTFEMFGDQVANAEMLRGTLTTVKLFVFGAALMIAFMAFAFGDLTVKSQVFLIIGAIVPPLVATGTCFSLLGWFGQSFNSIMCITPFLIFGIGVDDAFLLLNCWRRDFEKFTTNSDRLASVLKSMSPSMAITSLTNTMAFGVGFLSPTPQMSSFCLCTALAMLLDFILEFLVFVPILIIFYESKNEKKVEKERKVTWDDFSNSLLSKKGNLSGVLLYTAIITTASYGVRQLESTFDPSKTFPSDSRLVDSLENFKEIQSEYTPLNFLSKMPDPSNLSDVTSYEEMLGRIENREDCYGKDRSHNLFRDYLQFLDLKNSSVTDYSMFDAFIEERGIKDFKTVQYHTDERNETVIDLVNFIIICKGKHDWGHKALALEDSRNIIDQYPQYNVSLFDYDATIYDLIITVKSELITSVLITFTCMTIACFIIMPSFIAPTIASIATLSISFCLVGFLSLWGQNLDPVTMIDVVMAIGFSVDYSAHVCYHYYVEVKSGYSKTSFDVVKTALGHCARPLIEASITTLLCMLPLFIVPVYIIRSFAKTVVLVNIFGILHGLIFLPIVLVFVPLPSRFIELPQEVTEHYNKENGQTRQ